jgi:hypothetical protein
METKDVVTSSDELAVKSAGSKSRRTKWIVGAVALIVLLAAAAYVGGRLLTPSGSQGGLVPGSVALDDAQADRPEYVPASELPASDPDAIGPFVERQDNSLFVATRSKFMILTNKDGSVRTEGVDSGQRLEVVVTTDTTFYKDVTGEQFVNNAAAPNNGEVRQAVVAGALNEIGSNSIVSAWGERRGDRVVARVVVYTPAQIIPAPDQ